MGPHPFGERFNRAIAAIDAANADDPNLVQVDGELVPKEMLYGRRMSDWVERLEPEASEALRLAARSQHIRRWRIPRADYPMNRSGYHRWRTALYRFHAETAAAILQQEGYTGAEIERVGELLQKKNLKSDPEMQTLEDAAALVFLEHHFAEFAARPDVDEAKMIGILRKTWAKMSPRGQAAAQQIPFESNTAKLVALALSPAAR